MLLPVVKLLSSNPHLIIMMTAVLACELCVILRKVGITFTHLLGCRVTAFLGQPHKTGLHMKFFKLATVIKVI